MLYACLGVVAVFIIFITTTYLMTKKTYAFDANGKNVKLVNAGSSCKIYVDGVLVAGYNMPQFINGEVFKIKVGEEEIAIKCKSNAFGTKLSVKAYVGEKEIYNNGIKVKIKDEKKEA